MPDYALISGDGATVIRISHYEQPLTEDVAVMAPRSGKPWWLPITDERPELGEGQTYGTPTLTIRETDVLRSWPVIDATPQPRLIDFRTFMDRLSEAKQDAVFAASLTNARIARYVARASAAPFNIDSPEVTAGIDYLIALGLLDADDKAKLLA